MAKTQKTKNEVVNIRSDKIIDSRSLLGGKCRSNAHAQWCLLTNISDVAGGNVEPRKVGMVFTFRRTA